MCGIAGIIDFRGVDPTPLERMSSALRHRGPDDAGVWTDELAALAHRRLAIIDLSPAGRQPMTNEAGDVLLVFNGEVYNYRELRRELEERGHAFRSETDAETVVHLYEEFRLAGKSPVAMIHRLSGMFAFALWDARDRVLVLARDPLGQKPLYYSHSGGRLLFASELKSLIEHPEVDRQVDRDALAAYLLLGYIPAPASIFRAVRKLPAGAVALFTSDGMRIERYFVPQLPDREARENSGEHGPPRDTEASLTDRIEEALDDAVHRRLTAADVDVGILLSGGIDSTLIAALAVRHAPRVQTFSMGFSPDAPKFDETSHAARVASVLGTDHHVQRFWPQTMVDLVAELPKTFDEPFADASALPTLLLARYVARHVKCALGGDGGDELFGGYPTLRAQRWARRLHLLELARSAWFMERAARFLPKNAGYYPVGYVLERFARGLHLPAPDRQVSWTAYIPPDELETILPGAAPWPDCLESVLDPLRSLPEDAASRLLDQRLYLADDILVKTDRTSMAASLEVRAPFLDREVVELANSVPTARTINKRILRRLLARTPVGFIRHRPKHGFAVPVAEWLRGPLRGWAEDLLPEAGRIGLDKTAVARLWEEHLTRRRNRWREVWCILMLCEWSGHFRASF